MAIWRTDLIKVNKYTRPAIKISKVRKIVLHWTANYGATAEDHQRYFNGSAITSKRFASAHLFVDPNESVLIVPLDEVCYHANDNYKFVDGKPYRGVPEISPNANKYSIGVEMCVEKDGTISPKTIDRTALTIAELCKIHKLTEKDIVRHYDVTGKNCPEPFTPKKNPKGFEDLKNKVKSILNPPPAKPIIPILTRILKRGSTGSDVNKLQYKLGVFVDGKFGSKTESAVKTFQKANGLVVDGKVGQKTWTKLYK